ncbi:hypothetical protein NECID01_1986 [Nematocida sp. AWRm77]|nr:hypothetical protein NECID01_1986 [Nematocida sp. AWRm77]
MRLHMCRRNSAVPVKIVGVALNEKRACVVRENGVLELYSMPHLSLQQRIDVGAEDVQSAVFDRDNLLLGSLSQGLVTINCKDYTIRRGREAGLWRMYAENGQLLSIYSMEEGGSELRVNGQTVYSSEHAVFTACFGSTPGDVLAGNEKGRVFQVRDGCVVFEARLGEYAHQISPQSSGYGNQSRYWHPKEAVCIVDLVPTCMAHVVGAEYAVCTQTGEVFIVDTDAQVVKQTIKARESSLNVICVVGEKIYVSGADARILCYAKTGSGEYAKHVQHSTHLSDVLCMGVHGESIITGGEDGIVCVQQISSLGVLKKISRYPTEEVGSSRDKIFLCSGREITVAQATPQGLPGTSAGTSSTSSRGRQEGGYATIFKHIAKYPVLSVACAPDSDVAAVRTREGVKVYRYAWDTFGVELLKTVKGCVLMHSIVENTLWYVTAKAKEKELFLGRIDLGLDLARQKTWSFREVGLDFVPSRIERGRPGELVFSGESLGVFSEEKGVFSKIDVPYSIHAVFYNGKDLIMCTKENDPSISTQAYVMKYSFAESALSMEKEIELDFLGSAALVGTHLLVANQAQLVDVDTVSCTAKYFSFGKVLDSVFPGPSSGVSEAWCVQSWWKFTRQRLPPRVTQIKYGRK